MRITHVIFSLLTGGAETMLIDLVNQQIKTNPVSLIIINHRFSPTLLSALDHRIKVIKIKRPEGSINPLYLVKLNYNLWKLRPSVVHCHNHKARKLLFLKANYCLTIHDVNIPIINFGSYNKLFAISKAVKEDVENRSNFKPILIENGIEVDSILPKTNYQYDVFRIVQVSRLDHGKKGQDILLHALKKLVHDYHITNISVDFIGDNESDEALPTKKYLESIIQENNLNDYVSFLGERSREWIYNNLRDYNLLVQPSRFEGFGLTIAEAMTAKLPVLVSNIEGPMEVVRHGEYGHFFKTEDSTDCADQIRQIKDNYTTEVKSLEKAYQYCVNNYSIESTARKYIAAY